MSTDDSVAKAERAKQSILREAHEVGCDGLIAGVAIRLETGNRVPARNMTKQDGPFVCPKCWTPAVVHKDRGGGKIEHFAHNAPLSPLVAYGESATHKSAKEEICQALEQAFPDGNWAVERTLKNKLTGKPELRPDISGRIGKTPLVIEIQWSTLSLATILKRSIGYKKWNIPVLWILPLAKDIEDEFRPRSFERYLHSMYFGRVYYWKKGDGLLVTPTHFDGTERWVDTREWVDSGGEQSAGGYFKRLRLLKVANKSEKIYIHQHFHQNERPEFTPWCEKCKIPELILWQDDLAVWWDVNRENEDRRDWEEADALI